MPGFSMSVYIRYVFLSDGSVFSRPRLSSHDATDAVPKKRGPKTDVLEALLKRVDGLEARLKDKKADAEAEGSESAVVDAPEASTSTQSASNAVSGAAADAGQEPQDTIVFSPAQSK
jgi:hypothetical protein